MNEPEKHWKFSARDVAEREHWDSYMHAYEKAMNATSRPYAPWYAVPADDKPYLRTTVAQIVEGSLASLGLEYPRVSEDEERKLRVLRDTIV